MNRLNRVLAAFLVLLATCAGVQAQICGPYPNVLTNGTTADANQVMADFNLIRNCVNANVAGGGSNTNITSLSGLTTPLSVGQGGTPLFIGGTSTGSANAQVVASTTPNSFTFTQGYLVSWVAGFSNTGATTLNVFSTGVKQINKMTGGGLAAVVSGDIVLGTEYYATWDGTVFELLNPSSGAVTSVGVVDGTNGGLSFTGSPITSSGNITGSLKPSDLLTKASPTTSDSLVIMDAAASNAAKTATIPNVLAAQTIHGTLTAGTSNVMNPYVASTTDTQAHGLGAVPGLLKVYLQNVTSEHNYNVGDQVPACSAVNGNAACVCASDGTNTYIVTSNNQTPNLIDRSTNASFQLTAADWELVCVPYKIN